MSKQINLGDKVRTQFLNGCIRLGVTPDKLRKDQNPNDTFWFDEPQCAVVERGVITPKSPDTGGPMPSIPQRQPNAKR